MGQIAMIPQKAKEGSRVFPGLGPRSPGDPRSADDPRGVDHPPRRIYWKSSLNMAQPEAGAGEGESIDERLLLNTFPSPAKAKHIKESMMSFFIVL